MERINCTCMIKSGRTRIWGILRSMLRLPCIWLCVHSHMYTYWVSAYMYKFGSIRLTSLFDAFELIRVNMLRWNVLDFLHFQLVFIQVVKKESDICRQIYQEKIDFHIFGDAHKSGIEVDEPGSILIGADGCICDHYLKKCFLAVSWKNFIEFNKKPQLTVILHWWLLVIVSHYKEMVCLN